jgi:hypothetical protein
MLRGMSRWALLAVAIVACGKSAGNQDTGSKAAPPSGPEKIVVPGSDNTPTPVEQAKAPDNPQFHLQPEEGTLTIEKVDGKPCSDTTANVKVEPAAGYHVSMEYPIKLALEAPDGVKLPKAELTAGGSSKSAGDAKTYSEKMLEFDVKSSADKPGSYEIKGTFKFGVCDKESCHPKKQPITIQIACK